jgi:hypothetical protein
MKTIRIHGTKGGVGTSTVAVAIALGAAEQGVKVTLTGTTAFTADLFAAAGVAQGERSTVNDNLVIVANTDLVPASTEVLVVDEGVLQAENDHDIYDRTKHVYVTNTTYAALRRTVNSRLVPTATWVAVVMPGSALVARDICDVVGSSNVGELVGMEVDPAVQRAADAGVLARRVPKGLKPAVDLGARLVADLAVTEGVTA